MRNFAVLPDGKYLLKDARDKLVQVAKLLEACEFNHALALARKEKGNNFRLIAPSITPLNLIVSHISTKLLLLNHLNHGRLDFKVDRKSVVWERV